MKYFIFILFFSISLIAHDSNEKHKDVTYRHLIENIPEKKYYELLNKSIIELWRKGSFYALLSINAFVFYPDLDQKTDWGKLTLTRSNVYWALKALDMAFEKGTCFQSALSKIGYSSCDAKFLYSNLGSTYYGNKKYVKDPNKFESLKNFIPYCYASLYAIEKLHLYESEQSYYSEKLDKKINSHPWIVKTKQKIEKELNKEDQNKVWNIIHDWETRDHYEIYNSRNSIKCTAHKGRKELHQKMIELYLKD